MPVLTPKLERWFLLASSVFLIAVIVTACSPASTEKTKAGPSASSTPAVVVKTDASPKLYEPLDPEKRDHDAGSRLVLRTLMETSFGKGDWAMAHGLTGVTMLDISVVDRVAYQSFFLANALGRWKLRSVLIPDNNSLLLNGEDQMPAPSSSIIARREAVLYAAAYHLQSRYVYNDDGNFARVYKPSPYPKGNALLRGVLSRGLTILRELRKRGFEDKTMQNILGVVFASLARDGAIDRLAPVEFGHVQVCRDSLEAALTRLREKPQHSLEVLEVIGAEMEARGLGVQDEMLLPPSKEALDAILKIVAEDLFSIGPRPEAGH